jgi:hypothetical protein
MLPRKLFKETKKHVIAYLDMLGTSDKISKDNDNLDLNILHKIYSDILQYRDDFKTINIKIFSDNIVISKELSEDPVEELKDVLLLIYFTSNFLTYSLYENWLVRGGITIGNLYIDNIMIWGKGLVRSYKLEDKLSIYPRVIIDNKIINRNTFYNNIFLGRQDHPPFFEFDFDGILYINYLKTVNRLKPIDNNRYKDINIFIIKEFKDNINNDSILQKIQWTINYLNNYYDSIGLSEYKIDIANLNIETI